MLKDKLNELMLQFEEKELKKIDILIELMDVCQSEEYDQTEKQENAEEFCEIFWILSCVIKLDFIDFDLFSVKQFKTFIDYLKVLSIEKESEKIYASKGIVLVQFLSALSNKDKTLFDDLKEKFKVFYEAIGIFAEQFSWIFKIKNEHGEYVYPIHELINGVVEDAKNPTEVNLVQLFFALQIYTKIKVDDITPVRQQVRDIAQKYNIKFLDLLCNNGSIIGGNLACRNNLINQVLMVHDGSKLIIRSTKKDYFGGQDVQAELNSESTPIAWFCEIKIEENWEFSSLEKILLGDNKNNKIEVLCDISKKNSYNVFYDDAFIIDRNNGRYLRTTNIFNDRQIVASLEKSYDNLSKNFWMIMREMKNGIRGVILKDNRVSTNVLTIDFLSTFYTELMDYNWKYTEYISNIPEDDFYQNSLIKLFFEERIECGKIEDALVCYLKFVEKYIHPEGIAEKSSMELVPKLIMPYQIYVPFNAKIDDFWGALLEKDYFPKGKEIVSAEIKRIRNKNQLYVDSKQIHLEKIEFDGEDFNSLPVGPYWVVKKTDDVFFISLKWRSIEKYLIKLNTIKEQCFISKEVFLNDSEFSRIVEIVKNTGFTDKLLKLYGMSIGSNKKILAIFKLYWHMQLFIEPGKEKEWFEKFKDLLLNKYYSDYVLNSDEWDGNFVDQIKQLENDDILFIGKESYGDGGTLCNIISKKLSDDRSIIKWAFDADKLNANLKKDDALGYYLNTSGREHKTISKIIFLIDNIISGSSTNKMLNYYFKGCGESKRSFLKLEKKIDDVFVTNNQILGKSVEIEIRCIFALDDESIPYGKSKVESENSRYTLKVNAMRLVPYNDYKVNENVGEMIAELYDKKYNSGLSDRAYVLRAHNMPCDKMLPDCMLKIETMGGLLQRRDEL